MEYQKELEEIKHIIQKVPMSNKNDFIQMIRSYLVELKQTIKTEIPISQQIKHMSSKKDIEKLLFDYIDKNLGFTNVIVEENENFKLNLSKNILNYLIDNNFPKIIRRGFLPLENAPFKTLLFREMEENRYLFHKSIAMEDQGCFDALEYAFKNLGSPLKFCSDDELNYFFNSKTKSGHTCIDIAIIKKRTNCLNFLNDLYVSNHKVKAIINKDLLNKIIAFHFDQYYDFMREFLLKTVIGGRFMFPVGKTTFIHQGLELMYDVLKNGKKFREDSFKGFLLFIIEVEDTYDINFMVENKIEKDFPITIRDLVVDISKYSPEYPEIHNYIEIFLSEL